MTNIDDGGPAFPVAFIQGSDPHGADADGGNIGMTLRDWFAGNAIPVAAKLEYSYPTGSEGEPTYTGVATRAYFLADSMIKARKESAK